ncbi:hypothetical protein Pcinc_038814 [Petrolisthes cinctipes]|uniref:HAT C-terminal dimerisation domain-containing protein n=1 Tax=Petrolisthes cinctipes TaxID=88211 RepID=A0AAE1BQ75_PETCI|nr:hypothetical protein Pcinc_038814 [Petrolisthes cinctipes]
MIDEELAKMIAKDFQPFSVVEDKGFKNYCLALNPSYVLPARKTLSQKIIPKLYDRQRESLQTELSKASAVCITSDSWTSRATSSFMAVTCHYIEDYKMKSCLLDCFEVSERHTSENLAEELLKVAQEWKIKHKVDNAANIVKSIKLLKWTYLPCLAHTINLIVRDALKVIKSTVDKVKGIVEFFHKSTTATQKLKNTQRQLGLPELRPIQDCITRWNSTLHMLKRVLDLREAIISTLALLNTPIELLYPHEWDIVKEACTVLEPFEQVTVEISGEQYVTASKMIILCRGLQIATTHHQTSGTISTENITEMVQVISASMEKRFHRMEFNNVLAEASVLDPRFKKLAFNDSTALDEAVQRLKTAAANCTRNEPSAPPGNQGEAVSQEVEKHTSTVWRFFDERATEDTTRRNPSADAILENRSYLDEPRIQRVEDPLSWWKSKAPVYPFLPKSWQVVTCVCVSSS